MSICDLLGLCLVTAHFLNILIRSNFTTAKVSELLSMRVSANEASSALLLLNERATDRYATIENYSADRLEQETDDDKDFPALSSLFLHKWWQ